MTEPLSRDRLHEIILALHPDPLVGELTREVDRCWGVITRQANDRHVRNCIAGCPECSLIAQQQRQS